jgi:two-component system, NarL family, response regulator LiaR
MIRLLIADDHRVFCQGLACLFEQAQGFAVVGQAGDGEEAVRLARALKPDVALMDIHMPVMDGIQATRLICEAEPQTRVVMLTMYRDDEHVLDAIAAGAHGYILKEADSTELVEAVRRVYRGEAGMDAALASRVLDEFRRLSRGRSQETETLRLTPQDAAILGLVAQGLANGEIAGRLSLSERSVGNRLTEIYHKIGVTNRVQAARYALRRGWDGDLTQPTG